MKRALPNLGKDIADWKSRIEELRKELASTRGKLTNVRKQLENEQQRASSDGDQIEFLRRALATMTMDRNTQAASADRLKGELEKSRNLREREARDFSEWMNRFGAKTVREQAVHRAEIAHWEKQVENEKTGRANDAASKYRAMQYRPNWVPSGDHYVTVCEDVGYENVHGMTVESGREILAWETRLRDCGTPPQLIGVRRRQCIARLVFIPQEVSPLQCAPEQK